MRKRRKKNMPFEELIMPIPESGCWIWMGVIGRDGYGDTVLNGYMQAAHRYSWEIHNGPIPQGLWVLHKCDIKSCVNPDHLFLGTQKDNLRDASIKGILSRKITNEEVFQIMDLYNYGFSKYAIANMFGVGKTSMRKVIEKRYPRLMGFDIK